MVVWAKYRKFRVDYEASGALHLLMFTVWSCDTCHAST